MGNQKQSKPKVRLAEVEDFDRVYPLLQLMNSSRLNKDDWFRLFENHWDLQEFSPGIVLETNNEIVGYLGTIYSVQTVQGIQQVFCNLTTWIVKEDYRSHSIMMILSLLRKKNVILTSFSSNNVTYEVYKKLGFKEITSNKRIVYALPSLKSKQYEIYTDSDNILQRLNPDESKLFIDHQSFNNTYLLLQYQDQHCLLMGVSRKKTFRLYYVSDKSFLQKHLTYFRYKLMTLLNINKIQIDEQLLDNKPLFLSRKTSYGMPYQYKGEMEQAYLMAPIYSEVFLLNL